MSHKAKFNVADCGLTGSRGDSLLLAYTAAYRKGLSNAGIATAMHNALPNIKHVAHVSDNAGAATIRTKFHDGNTVVLHTYAAPVIENGAGYSWVTDVTFKDGDVILH